MSLFSSLLGGIGTFLPGPWGAVAKVGAGLLGADEARHNQRNQQKKLDSVRNTSMALAQKGIDANTQLDQDKIAAFHRLMDMADKWNPQQSDQAGLKQAGAETQQNIQDAIHKLVGQYVASGGVPGNSSAFNVNTQAVTDRAADPFRQYAAQLATTEFQRKQQALQSALGSAPGNIGDAYFKAAQISSGTPVQFAPQQDMSGIQKLITDSLAGIGPMFNNNAPRSQAANNQPAFNGIPTNNGAYNPMIGVPALNPNINQGQANSFFSNPVV